MTNIFKQLNKKNATKNFKTAIAITILGCLCSFNSSTATDTVKNNKNNNTIQQTSNSKATKKQEKVIPPDDLKRLKELAKETQNVELTDLIFAYKKAKLKESIIKAMNRPGEAKPWYEYRKIFIVPKRIDLGVEFYKKNKDVIEKAAQTYNVAPEIIVAILGVETYYGANMGNYRVLDALFTLGFNYPKRAPYFSKEFANYVRLAKQEKWNHNNIKGSYAGAMGMGQFMPWSYLTWAVDFNGDGKKDLFNSVDDAIGSTANYFKEHGWDPKSLVAVETSIPDEVLAINLMTDKLELNLTVGELREEGIKVPNNLDNNTPCKIVKLEVEKDQFKYYIAFNNFYSISLYNRSPLYVMAVYELSQIIKDKINASETETVDTGSDIVIQ